MKMIFSASSMREISQKYAPLKLTEHIEETFNKVMKDILEAEKDGTHKTAFLLNAFAADNEEVAKAIKTRCEKLGYTVKYHNDMQMMEFSW